MKGGADVLRSQAEEVKSSKAMPVSLNLILKAADTEAQGNVTVTFIWTEAPDVGLVPRMRGSQWRGLGIGQRCGCEGRDNGACGQVAAFESSWKVQSTSFRIC